MLDPLLAPKWVPVALLAVSLWKGWVNLQGHLSFPAPQPPASLFWKSEMRASQGVMVHEVFRMGSKESDRIDPS